MHSTLFKVLQDDPEPLRRVSPELPGPLDDVVERALAKDPRQRFQNGAELLEAVKQMRQALAAPPEPAPRPKPRARDAVPAPAGAAKILLVEDNEMNRDMLSRRLERRGYKVVIAVDGSQAVSMADSEAPDLILMDMSLPVMSGWEATKRIKADAALRSIPVIALTAHAMAGDKETALQAGCDDYDTKPVELNRLLGKIGALLKKAGIE
jgi:CheY-like chemotaxis protein